jgi:peptidoglycan/xylan/chitin deacetylase (PgdA/CDA1 family)
MAALVALSVCLGAAPAAAETTVSLSFDDGSADQMTARQILAEHGLRATFFIISERIGMPRYLTSADLAAIYADGNEIGGHTVTHRDLTTLPQEEQREEICGGRQALLTRGYPQLSFAYPFGHHDSISERLAQECGYLSARGSGGLTEYPAESVPPLNRWAIRTRNSVRPGDTVEELEASVRAAEATGGGWLTFVFHRVCEPSADPKCPADWRIAPADLDAFLGWLQGRELIGTQVRTIGEVIAANPQPLFQILGVRSRRDGTARLRVYAGSPGLLQVRDAPAGAAIAAKPRPRIGKVSLPVAHAGTMTLVLRPGSAGKALLHRKGKLRALAQATFTPVPGTSPSGTVKVRFRAPGR